MQKLSCSMKRGSALLLVLIGYVGCANESDDRYAKIIKRNSEIADSLKFQHPQANTVSDTLLTHYTTDIQDLYINGGDPVIIEASIIDISATENSYVIYAEDLNNYGVRLKLECSQRLADRILSVPREDYRITFIVANIKEVQPLHSFMIDWMTGENDRIYVDETKIIVDYDLNYFIAYGECIDLVVP